MKKADRLLVLVYHLIECRKWSDTGGNDSSAHSMTQGKRVLHLNWFPFLPLIFYYESNSSENPSSSAISMCNPFPTIYFDVQFDQPPIWFFDVSFSLVFPKTLFTTSLSDPFIISNSLHSLDHSFVPKFYSPTTSRTQWPRTLGHHSQSLSWLY